MTRTLLAPLILGAVSSLLAAPLAAVALEVDAHRETTLFGSWCIHTSNTTTSTPPLILPRSLSLEPVQNGTAVSAAIAWADSSNSIVSNWTVAAGLSGQARTNTVASRVWPYNVYVGVEYDVSRSREVKVTRASEMGLELEISEMLATSQDIVPVQSSHTFSLASDGSALEYRVNTTASPAPFVFEFRRRGAASSCSGGDGDSGDSGTGARAIEAPRAPPPSPLASVAAESITARTYVLNMTDDWMLNSTSFQWNAVAVALQGLTNRDAPRLYLQYPPTWDFTYTVAVREYLASERGISFESLHSAREALSTLLASTNVSGYVVWDPEVRESLAVAFTAAGVLDAIPVTVELLPAVEALGLRQLLDLRQRFRGQSPQQIYGWAWDRFGPSVNRSMVVWAGGVCAPKMQPGVMDFGVAHRSFFTDLSTLTTSSEYALADRIVGQLQPRQDGAPPLVMGWHSYCKDEEHTFTTLASKHGARVHGLNTNPNLSFVSLVPVSPGFVFRNNLSPSFKSSRHRRPELHDKVAITLVQTDGLGLGAWARPGRGSIPYAWEVMLPDLELQPALLEMFYRQSTPKDVFVAALSGPGYMYPRAVPEHLLPERLAFAQKGMKKLDLHHMVIFDASQTVGPHTVTGDTNLTPDIVDAYFANMASTVGFLNGYAPSFTDVYDNATSRGLISFDYYLDPGRSVDAAVSDLHNLARLNTRRPYLLAVHVREFSAIGKVEQILDRLSNETFAVLPIDEWFELANSQPTFRQHLS